MPRHQPELICWGDAVSPQDFSVSYDNLIQTSDTGTLLAQHQLRIITQGAPAT